jgi:hypothetical protein
MWDQNKNEFGLGIFHQWQSDNTIRVNQENLLLFIEKITTDENCKFRQTVLLIFNHLLANMDNESKVEINARQLSKKLGVHYDTATKCIKYLKQIEVIKPVQ